MSAYDVIVTGNGAGSGTLVHPPARPARASRYSSAATGVSRGPQNWSAADVFIDNWYISEDTWCDAGTAKSLQPQVHYFVGDATKPYGAALYRLRKEDFGELRHDDGISPAWAIGYDETEPSYAGGQVYYLEGQVGRRAEVPTKWIGARLGERQSALIEGELASVERAPRPAQAAR